mmetsp:Transcript_29950/g.42735  ORF Transcript_29950/g.42735 Transcript_29950/m.42735 type:complete len:395 (+) Transcript_29950:148-1332(+)
MLLTLNILFGLPEFGKIIFAIADVLVGIEVLKLLETSKDYKTSTVHDNKLRKTQQQRSQTWALIWMINPMTINICTRGSADSIANYVVLRMIQLTKTDQIVSAGFLLGLAIHLRLYPIIFLPAFFLHLSTPSTSSTSSLSKSLINTTSNHTNKTPPIGIRCLRTLSYIFSTYEKSIHFTLATIGSCFFFTMLSYELYGFEYLQQSIFFHFIRADHRHNFSIHFYWIYLTKIIQFASPSHGWNHILISGCIKVGVFIPQLVLYGLIIVTFAEESLEVCLLLQTMIFVTYNKVITAQYFSWIFTLLFPVLADYHTTTTTSLSTTSLNGITYNTPMIWWIIFSALAWVIALTVWLSQAYLLEFCGVNNFYLLWQSSVAFHLVSVVCIGVVAYGMASH